MRIIRGIFKDRLVGNSLYLMMALALTSLVGFIFWIVCARLFTSEDVGLAATMIAGMGLITSLTIFGFDYGIIKFWSRSDKSCLISSCFSISFYSAIILGMIFIFLFRPKGHSLTVVQSALFVLLTAAWVLYTLNDSVYIGMRKTVFVFAKHMIFNIFKLLLPFLVLASGFFGIFSAYTLSALFGLMGVYLLKPFRFINGLSLKLVRSIFRFSMINYLSTIFVRARELIAPLVITFFLGPSKTAYFFVAFNVTIIFLLVPKSLSKVLLAEASHDMKTMKKNLRKAFTITILISLLLIIFLVAFGKYLLFLYGPEYSRNSLDLLLLFSISGFFSGINEVYYSVMRIEMRLRRLICMQMLNAVLTLTVGGVLLFYSLEGIAIGWLISEVLVFMINIMCSKKLNLVKVIMG